MKKIILLVLCSGLLNGCVGFFISQATQAAVETVKVPFKIVGRSMMR